MLALEPLGGHIGGKEPPILKVLKLMGLASLKIPVHLILTSKVPWELLNLSEAMREVRNLQFQKFQS